MFKRITSTVFNAVVVLVAIAVAAWLTISGHTLTLEGLWLAMAAILGAVMFSFRLVEGFGSDRLSLWVGPLGSIRRAPRAPSKSSDVLRDAA